MKRKCGDTLGEDPCVDAILIPEAEMGHSLCRGSNWLSVAAP